MFHCDTAQSRDEVRLVHGAWLYGCNQFVVVVIVFVVCGWWAHWPMAFGDLSTRSCAVALEGNSKMDIILYTCTIYTNSDLNITILNIIRMVAKADGVLCCNQIYILPFTRLLYALLYKCWCWIWNRNLNNCCRDCWRHNNDRQWRCASEPYIKFPLSFAFFVSGSNSSIRRDQSK